VFDPANKKMGFTTKSAMLKERDTLIFRQIAFKVSSFDLVILHSTEV